MNDIHEYNIDEETIRELGLQRSTKPVNAHIAPNARVFEYPGLENIFIMENDLYGNIMPKDSCFLAFYGNHGLIGKHIKLKTLRHSSVQDILDIVANNNEG